jgi:hypothetical protein
VRISHLVGIQPSGLEQDAVGDRHLADVMERGCEIDVAAQPRRKAELFGDDAAISGDPQRMLAGVVVAVFDRERETQDDLLLALL